MKAIKINKAVNLNSAITIPAGSIVVMLEKYDDIKKESEGKIPTSIPTAVYANLTAFTEGKANVQGIADFNPLFLELKVSREDFEIMTAPDVFVKYVSEKLEAIYPGKIEAITI